MKKRALLIGINDYDFLGKLSFARRDAQAFAEVLKKHCNFDENEISVMTCNTTGGLRGLGSYMENALGNLTRHGDLELLIFGFWGHGYAPDGKRRYLCGLDARDENLARSAVSLDLVQAKLAQVGALNTLLILDCCQNRPVARGAAVNLEAGAQEQFAAMARDIQSSPRHVAGKGSPTTAILNSCSVGQLAFEWEKRAQGIFTAHLLDALKQGETSVAKLAAHVCAHTSETARALYHKEQIPWFSIEGRGDITLPGSEDTKQPWHTEAQLAWREIKDSPHIEQLIAFKNRYVNTIYGDYADIRINELHTATDKANKKADEEKKRRSEQVQQARRMKDPPPELDASEIKTATVKKPVRKEPTAQDFFQSGNAYYNKGEYDRAIADYDKVIRLKPDYASTYYNRGIVYKSKGEYDRAIADYDKAIRFKLDDADIHYNRGITYGRKGEHDRTFVCFGKVIIEPYDAVSYNDRGIAYRKKGAYDRALADFDKALKLKPDYAFAHNNRNRALEAMRTK